MTNINYTGLVTIIIPSYNRYELLLESIYSCINQTYKNLEIIVINDCSTDDRYYNGVIEKIDNRIILLHLPINMRKKYNTRLAAQGMTRQEGINIAKGEWIAFLDDDDFYITTKLERQLKELEKFNSLNSEQILFTSSNMFGVKLLKVELDLSYNNLSIPNVIYNIEGIYLSNVPNNILTLDNILRVNHITNSTVLLHKSIINKAGNFTVCNSEDWEYWKKCLKYTNCLYISDCLTYYTLMNPNKYYEVIL